MLLYKIENLTKYYGAQQVLNVPQLEIFSETVIGVLGRNGAGKTTLLRLMLDMIPANSGTVEFEGKNIRMEEEWKAFVGSYLDENMLLGFLTPDEFFETLRKIYGLSEVDMQNHFEVFEPMFNDEIVGAKKYIRDLSKGNIKKVGIAAAFLNNPQVVILDEPFENLDPASHVKLKELFNKLKEERKITIMISSHDIYNVLNFSDRILILDGGVIRHDLSNKENMKQTVWSHFGI
jgi:ABC-2 type transport system ATP-binding protein